MKYDKPLNPFVGLRPLTSGETHLLFGREKQITTLLELLKQSRFLALSGDSGVGKTSLIQAGVIPQLHAGFEIQGLKSWKTVVLNPGEFPIINLIQSLLDAYESELNPEDMEKLYGEIQNSGAKAIIDRFQVFFRKKEHNLLIVVDSFEDIFHVSAKKENANVIDAFIKTLKELTVQSELPIFTLLIIRSDFLEDCDNYPLISDQIKQNCYHLSPLTKDTFRDIIEQPIIRYGESIDGVLIDQILNDIAQVKYQLPILQFTLMRLWEIHSEKKFYSLNLSYYHQIGTIKQVVNLYADSILKDLNPDEQRIAELFFRSLIYLDSKNRMSSHTIYLGELPKLIEAETHEIAKIVDLFYSGGRSLIIIDEDMYENDLTITLSHDSLPVLWDTYQTWVDEERRSRRIYLNVVDAAKRYETEEGSLIQEPLLSEAKNWKKQNKITRAWAEHYHPDYEQAMSFLERSMEASEIYQPGREETKHSTIVLLLNVVLIILFLGGIFLLEREKPMPQVQHIAVVDTTPPQPTFPAINEENLFNFSEELQKLEFLEITPLVAAQEPSASLVKKEPKTQIDAVDTTISQDLPKEEAPDYDKIYWDYGNRALENNDWLRASHFFALSAAETNQPEHVEKCMSKIKSLNRLLALYSQINLRNMLYGVEVSNDEKRLVTWGNNNSVQIWNMKNSALKIDPLIHNSKVWGATFSPNDRYILTWAADSTVRLWNVNDGTLVFKPIKHAGSVNGATFNKTGRLILSWCSGGTAGLWNTVNGIQAIEPLKHEESVKKAIFSDNERYILTLTYNGKVKLWDSEDGSLLSDDRLKHRPSGQKIKGMKFSKDDRQILTWTNQNVYLWNIRDLSPAIKPIEFDYGMLQGAKFSNDGRFIVTWDAYRYAQVWRTVNGTPVSKPLNHNTGVLGANFNYQNNRIVTWNEENMILIWDFMESALVANPVSHHNEVGNAIFSDNDDYLLSWGKDGIARLWSAKTATPQSIELLHAGALSGSEFSTSGEFIITWSRVDNSVKVWKMNLEEENQLTGLLSNDQFPNDRLPLLVEVLTGTIMDEGGNLRILNTYGWQQRKQQLREIDPQYFISWQN